MKPIINLFAPLFVSVFVVFSLCSCDRGNTSQDAEMKEMTKPENKILRVGISPDNPPFEYYDFSDNVKGQIVGFDAMLIKMIAKHLGKNVHFLAMDFSALIPALKAGRIDVIISAITPTQQRRKSIAFSQIYYISKVALVTRNPKEDTSGGYANWPTMWTEKVIGVQLGASHDNYLADLITAGKVKCEVNKTENLVQMIDGLRIGRLHGVLTSLAPAKQFVKRNKALLDYNELDDGIEFAIGLMHDNPLLERINKALTKMKADGSLAKLKARWLK